MNYPSDVKSLKALLRAERREVRRLKKHIAEQKKERYDQFAAFLAREKKRDDMLKALVEAFNETAAERDRLKAASKPGAGTK